MNEVRTLTHQCFGGTCYCDWRLQIYDCVNSHGLQIIYMVMILFSAIVSLFTFGIFSHRFFIKGHQLFDFSSSSVLKPRPVDCLFFFMTMFNLLRMLTGIILVTNVSQTNVLARTFMYEFPWQWGYGACALYLLGISQTLTDSHTLTTRQWLPSPRNVDIIGLTFLLAPFVLNNICSIAAGLMASRDLHKAEIFTQLLYLLWFIHCGSLACAVLYAGIRLLAFLTVHLKKFRKPNSKNLEQKRKLEAGMVKIRLLVFTICLSLTGFAVFLLLYGIFRDKIIHSVIGSYVLCIVWNFLAPLASFLGCLILVFDPRIDEKPTIKLTRSSSIEAISTSNQITSHMFTNSIAQQDTYDLSPGTLNADVFDALKEESQIHMNGYYQQGLKNNKEDGHLSRWSQSNLISPSPYETAHF